MTISVACPICQELLVVEFDGTLHGVVAITDTALMELTAPAEISQHMRSHMTPREDGFGFDHDPRYWDRLRQTLEVQQRNVAARLAQIDDLLTEGSDA